MMNFLRILLMIPIGRISVIQKPKKKDITLLKIKKLEKSFDWIKVRKENLDIVAKIIIIVLILHQQTIKTSI
jgi:hypothetical protein